MTKTAIDQDALIEMFATASAKQGEALRQGVAQAMLKALQGRELTLKNMRAAVKAVTGAASAGLERNPAGAPDVEAMLEQAVAGMDAALLQAVEANRRALSQLVEQGAAATAAPVQAAVAQLEQVEDMFFGAIAKAAEAAGGAAQGPWSQVLAHVRAQGTQAGGAAQSVTDMLAQAQGAMRAGRASGMKATQALLDSYTALVSGVLIGMSEGLQGASSASSAGASTEATKNSGRRGR